MGTYNCGKWIASGGKTPHISKVNLKTSTNFSKYTDGATSLLSSYIFVCCNFKASRKRCALKRDIDLPRLLELKHGSRIFTNLRLGFRLGYVMTVDRSCSADRA